MPVGASNVVAAPSTTSTSGLSFPGFLALFLELVLIRYVAGHIWNLGFSPYLVLLAAFLGMGTPG